MTPQEPGAAAGREDVCVTCGDVAVPVRVLALLGEGMARVDTGRSQEDVSVELVDAAVGDTLLVHAGVALGKLDPAEGDRAPAPPGSAREAGAD